MLISLHYFLISPAELIFDRRFDLSFRLCFFECLLFSFLGPECGSYLIDSSCRPIELYFLIHFISLRLNILSVFLCISRHSFSSCLQCCDFLRRISLNSLGRKMRLCWLIDCDFMLCFKLTFQLPNRTLLTHFFPQINSHYV